MLKSPRRGVRRLPRALAPVGERARRLEPQHRRSRALVAWRVRRNGGFCEGGCGRNEADVKLDWAHIFGREGSGACLGEPWASDPALCAGLCRDCHRRIDGTVGGIDAKLRNALRRTALERFAEEYHLPVTPYRDPVEGIRRLITLQEAVIAAR